MYIDCPACNENNDLDGDDLPDNACDNEEYECKSCEHVFSIGWYAVAEVRGDYLD